MWSPEYDIKKNKMGTTWHAFIKSILHNLLKSHTQNYHPTSLRNRIEGQEVCPATLHKLPHNWIICKKGGPNNFVQVTTILGNLCWKHFLLVMSSVIFLSVSNFSAVHGQLWLTIPYSRQILIITNLQSSVWRSSGFCDKVCPQGTHCGKQTGNRERSQHTESLFPIYGVGKYI